MKKHAIYSISKLMIEDIKKKQQRIKNSKYIQRHKNKKSKYI